MLIKITFAEDKSSHNHSVEIEGDSFKQSGDNQVVILKEIKGKTEKITDKIVVKVNGRIKSVA